MSLIIRANSFFVKRYLKVDQYGVEFLETAAFGGRRSFRFDQIDCILISPERILSFQVGNEVFRIQTKPGKAQHQQTIQYLLSAVAAAHSRASGLSPVAAARPT